MRRASLSFVMGLAAAGASFHGVAAADTSHTQVVVGDPVGGCGAWIDHLAVYALPPRVQFDGGVEISGCYHKAASSLPLTD